MLWCIHGGRRTTYGSRLSSLVLWALGAEPRSSGLVATAQICTFNSDFTSTAQCLLPILCGPSPASGNHRLALIFVDFLFPRINQVSIWERAHRLIFLCLTSSMAEFHSSYVWSVLSCVGSVFCAPCLSWWDYFHQLGLLLSLGCCGQSGSEHEGTDVSLRCHTMPRL